MSLEEPQSHKMPQREGKKQEEKKERIAILSWPIQKCIKRKVAKKKIELCLPLLLKFSVTDAEENGSKAQTFVG